MGYKIIFMYFEVINNNFKENPKKIWRYTTNKKNTPPLIIATVWCFGLISAGVAALFLIYVQ